MRRLVLAFVMIAALSGPATGQDLERPAMPDASAPSEPGPLRGPAQAERPLTLAEPAPGPDQCLAGCSRTYFFCLSSGDEDCALAWGQCRRACTRADTTRPIMASPLPLRPE